MKRGLKIAPLILIAIVVGYQFLSSEKYNPETGRTSRVGLSPQDEAALGFQSYQQVLAQSDVVPSGPEVDMSVRVVNRLVRGMGPESQKFDWQVSVIRSPQANAFCLPGGKIAVYTGILPIAQDEAGLATVLGHEIAHATSRHGAERLFQNSLVQTALVGAQLSLGDMSPDKRQAIIGLLGAGAQYGILAPFSRDHESEADEIGLIYMARAGYDPQESISFWERMAASSRGGQPPEFLSTHPSHETRIQRLRQSMPRAMEEFHKSASSKETAKPR